MQMKSAFLKLSHYQRDLPVGAMLTKPIQFVSHGNNIVIWLWSQTLGLSLGFAPDQLYDHGTHNQSSGRRLKIYKEHM